METALALPEEGKFRTDIEQINRFQKIVHQNLVKDQDYGVIPGTGNKPTLLKPGAEKIAKLLGLCDHYEIVDRQEDWGKPFFRYLVKCQLRTATDGLVVSEGFGECNSMESKYRFRWVWPKDLPADMDKANAVTKKVKTRNGYVTQYRVDNDDIFTQVNTLIKMAKKRSLVDAALSAGRLSNIFTQDIEDIEDTRPAPEPAAPQEAPQEPPAAESLIDMDWLKESLEELNWADVGKWLKDKYRVSGTSVSQMVRKLNREQAEDFVRQVQTRLEIARGPEPPDSEEEPDSEP